MHAGSTIGNPQLEAAGFQSEIHDMVSHLIEQSGRFVYVEDQYFWHHEMARRLGRRVCEDAIKLLSIVTNVSTGLVEHPLHTRLGLWNLARAPGSHTDRIVSRSTGSDGPNGHARTARKSRPTT